MVTLQDIIAKKESISLVGLGYVGLPIAVTFAETLDVIGFDNNKAKVELYNTGIDPTGEVGDEVLKKSTLRITSDASELKNARFHIVAVPTPIHHDKKPDLTILESATRTLAENLTKGSVVVFESTVYPGVTEDICVPILEQVSGLVYGQDFFVGYSPERINPGDKERTVRDIVKVVSGMDEKSLELIAGVYELIIDAGVYRASSIKVAEAAKVIENSQRDLNIAFMNELSVIFKRMNIDTLEVLKAAGTKWNFINFVPGLVGGHCIGVDPYYLTYASQQLGYEPQVILSGRRINDNMGHFVATNAVKELIKLGKSITDAKVGILGFTFKENCPDIRNTRVIDIVHELQDYGIKPLIHDPHADAQEVMDYYGIDMVNMDLLTDLDALIVPVSHDEFKTINVADLVKSGALLVDIKGSYNATQMKKAGYSYWRL